MVSGSIAGVERMCENTIKKSIDRETNIIEKSPVGTDTADNLKKEATNRTDGVQRKTKNQ